MCLTFLRLLKKMCETTDYVKIKKKKTLVTV